MPAICAVRANVYNATGFIFIVSYTSIDGSIWLILSASLEQLLYFALPGTRESAFLHAMAAASVAHAVTASCSAGLLPDCDCDNKAVNDFIGGRSAKFQWYGCSDDTDYGVTLSRHFVDSVGKRGQINDSVERSVTRLVNLHNSNVGRKVTSYSSSIIYVWLIEVRLAKLQLLH